jgi:multidrug transporter EmrE-like cation transporter
MNFTFFITVLIASFIEYFGDAQFKFYARHGKNSDLILGILAYAIMIGTLIYILRTSNVMYMNLNWDAISIIVETLMAYFLLHETLANNYQVAGFIAIVLGCMLLNVGKVPY